MLSDEFRIWSSIQLHNIYTEFGGSLTRKHLISQVKEYFGEVLIPLSSPGLAMMFIFAKRASSIMRIEKTDDEMTEVINITK